MRPRALALMLVPLALLLVGFAGCYPDAGKIRAQGTPDTTQPEFHDASAAVDAAVLGPDTGSTPADAALPADVAVAGQGDGPSYTGPDGAAVTADGAAPGYDDRQGGDSAEASNLGDGPDSVATACAAWASVACARFQACEPFVFNMRYPSLAKCQERGLVACNMEAALPGAQAPTAACTAATSTVSCTDWNNGIDPVECSPKGQFSIGSPCSANSQCQSGRCAFASGASCGQCAQRAAPGGTCASDTDCAHGLYCANGICVGPGAPGSACDSTHPCVYTLKCGAAGKCVQLGTEGAACTSYADCDVYSGLWCSTDQGKCVRISTSSTICSANSDGSMTACGGAGFCTTSGACLPPAMEGYACSDDVGPTCLLPATCVAGRCEMSTKDTTCVAPSGLGPDNAAMLFGPALGTGSEAASALRRTVPVSLLSSDFQAGPAYLGRPGVSVTGFTLIIQITNVSASQRCFIEADTLDLLGTAGTALESAPNNFVVGSVGWDSASGSYGNVCLSPGETGYLLDVSSSEIFSSITGVSLALSAGSAALALPKPMVVPQYYELATSGWEITAKNVGTAAADLTNGYHRAIYFAQDGLPLIWGFLEVTANPILAPGNSGTLGPSYDTAVGHGASVQQYVMLDYRGAASGAALTLEPSGAMADAEAKCRWRSSLQKEKLAQLR